MKEPQQWKVVRRAFARRDERHHLDYEAEPVAGPFESEAEALHWIEQHPQPDASLAAEPIRFSHLKDAGE